ANGSHPANGSHRADGSDRVNGGLGYLGFAYIVVFAAIGCYLIILDRRQRDIDRRLKKLRSSEDDAGE
ncbi:MAG: CcmD family protein, partial [Actinomycetota bacterium]